MTIEPREPYWRVGVQRTFAALRYRNYRLWFIGQLVSLLGTWMQITAQGYLVFELTHSSAYLGYVSFAAGIPPWMFMLYGGVVADRVDKRKLMMATQAAMAVLAAILAVITFLGVVRGWHILVLAFGVGIAGAFDAPARQALVVDLVERDDLSNAIALNSTMFNSATALGPAAAGVIYALAGPAWCFTINAISYLAILVALGLMRIDGNSAVRPVRSAATELKEGMRFVFGHEHIRMLMGLIMVLSLFGMSFATLIPAWAVKILGGDATTNGFLQSSRGLGALVGALLIASLGRFHFKGRLLTLASFAFPVALFLFAGVRWEPLSLLVLAGVGIAQIIELNLATTLVQILSPDPIRGRVMGMYSLAFFGFMPLGALLAGSLAEHVGEPLTVALGSLVTLLFAIWVRLGTPGLAKLS